MELRIEKLRHSLAEAGVDAALITHPRDLLYYAGTARPATLLVGPREATLYVRRGLELARREATVARVVDSGSLVAIAAAVAGQGLEQGVLGATFDVLPARLYLRLLELFPAWRLQDVSPLVLAQRMVKDAAEVRAVERAAAVADAGHAALVEALRPGMTELALVAEVELALRCLGYEGLQPLRHPGGRGGGILLMSGENLTVRGGHGLVVTGAGLSPASPYGVSRRIVQPGDLVVLDIGVALDGYTADESRTYVAGPPTAEQQALFDVALVAEDAFLAGARPGVPAADLYRAVQAVVQMGALPHFAPGDLVLPGFVGHGIGLELDEPPVIWDREQVQLAEGMVLALEIEVSAPAVGLMAKVEDSVVIEAEGPRLVTAAPRRLVAVA
ncbi:MAG: aminopeptidase P family protein [Anaerolineae bacterium]|nr:aminopeptidase P family protein [Anaerolineae bacterium]